jgi:hypothetical protein
LFVPAGGAFSAAGRIAASLGATLLGAALPARIICIIHMQTHELLCLLACCCLQAARSQQLAASLLA